MAATINNAAPSATARAEFDAAFRPTATLTGNTTLTWPAACGVYYIFNSASAITITLPNGSIPISSPIVGMNVGAGAVSFVAGGGESLLIDAVLPSTVGQYAPVEIRRGLSNTWVRLA